MRHNHGSDTSPLIIIRKDDRNAFGTIEKSSILTLL